MLHWLGSQQASKQAEVVHRTRRAPSSWVVLMAIEAPTRGTLLRSKRRTSRVCIIWPRSWDWWGHRKQRLVSRCSLEYIFCCCHSVSTALLTWGSFNNYVDIISSFWDHLSPYLHVDNNWHFLTTYPPHSVHVVFERPAQLSAQLGGLNDFGVLTINNRGLTKLPATAAAALPTYYVYFWYSTGFSCIMHILKSFSEGTKCVHSLACLLACLPALMFQFTATQ